MYVNHGKRKGAPQKCQTVLQIAQRILICAAFKNVEQHKKLKYETYIQSKKQIAG